MRAARIHAYGGWEDIRYDEIPIPEPGADEVLVRVKAASINPLDVKLVKGTVQDRFPIDLPYTLGTDIAGVVEEAGPLAARFSVGDTVFGRLAPLKGGGFAEFAVIPAIDAGLAPKTLIPGEVAGLPAACGTAWEALFELGKLEKGQSVLVHAGAGGVGSYAVQLAKLAGAYVFTTASGDGLQIARNRGADHVIDYRNEDFVQVCREVDLVIDTIGGATQERSFGVLKHGGTLVCITEAADERKAAEKNIKTHRLVHQMRGSRLELMAALMEQGKLTCHVDSAFPFEEIRAAIARNATRQAKGKILIHIGS
ncbi:NADP-dependent oxidoreductase [Agrobacterium salinitolerans]|uniref:NADP-dependent oxidoreductase n=1 Tax=Agrobacterium salinitolerans TaxID=1183413 RepID=UPI0015748B28|nr:NADP-dependent oxidoreductase [Agrobacterium salinitolerans]NTA40264.1 NADP-dependent oxidoreductase [Agrobacterium salinitolerans]